jgi:hypothetical protein
MVLDFKDEGCEIASEQLKKIYDPLYFSKKDSVGFGLSTVYQTVNENSFFKKLFFLRGLMMFLFNRDAQPVIKKTLLSLRTLEDIL